MGSPPPAGTGGSDALVRLDSLPCRARARRNRVLVARRHAPDARAARRRLHGVDGRSGRGHGRCPLLWTRRPGRGGVSGGRRQVVVRTGGKLRRLQRSRSGRRRLRCRRGAAVRPPLWPVGALRLRGNGPLQGPQGRPAAGRQRGPFAPGGSAARPGRASRCAWWSGVRGGHRAGRSGLPELRGATAPSGLWGLEVCAAECGANPRCRAFTFLWKEGETAARCFLKSRVPVRRACDDCVSGVK